MYRRLSSSLPQDPVFPADLKELGYFVNDQDEVKSIADPTKDFTYYINKNERYNERQREAMNTCIRQLVLQRLDDLGIRTLPLPIGTPSDKAHIPILASSNLPEKKRIILVFNEVMQDLGIWSYRTISRGGAGAISRGSAVELAKRLHGYATSPSDQSSPGLVIANPGQLLWWRGGKKAVSFVTWHSLPRKSAVHGPMRIDEVKNRVPGNEDWEKHVQYMFNEVMAKVTDEDVLIDVVGLSDGGYEALKFLNENWSDWSSRISAIALGSPLHLASELTNDSFAAFMKARGRAYICSPLPGNSPVPDTTFGCPTFAAGEELYTEAVMPAAHRFMLDFFNDVAMQGEGFQNKGIDVYGEDLDQVDSVVGRSANAA